MFNRLSALAAMAAIPSPMPTDDSGIRPLLKRRGTSATGFITKAERKRRNELKKKSKASKRANRA